MFPAQPNQSLIDGLSCLQTLASRDEPAGVRELARDLRLETTRVSRLLGTLAHLGFAERNVDRKYRPGPAMHVLSAQSLKASRLLSNAVPVLEKLRDGGLTVALGVLWRDQVCYQYFVKPGQPFAVGLFHFKLFPAEKSSIGLILLAEMARGEIEGITLTPQLRAQLRRIKADGYCELARPEGERTIGVTIGHPAIAGLAYVGKFPPSASVRLRQRLLEAAREITINYEGTDRNV